MYKFFLIAAILFAECECGQICQSCSSLPEGKFCPHSIQCKEDEVCFMQKYRTTSNEIRYDFGCAYPEFCHRNGSSMIIGKRTSDHSHILCNNCCNNSLICNARLTCQEISHASKQQCLSCSEIDDPSVCGESVSCETDEVCFVHKYTTESQQLLFDMGCKHKSYCRTSLSSSLVGRRNINGLHFVCDSCCSDSHLCNKNLTCDRTITTHHSPKECANIPNVKDGPYIIYPGDQNTSVRVFCVKESNVTWTVLQRRTNHDLNFNRTWQEYKTGFGSVTGDHWLGNDNIHLLTANGRHKIKFLLTSSDNSYGIAEYSAFLVGDETSKYVLTMSGYSGNTSDSMVYGDDNRFGLNGHKFTTYDVDNDDFYQNCGQKYGGGWWFNQCHTACLTGKLASGWEWNPWSHGLKSSIMMISKV